MRNRVLVVGDIIVDRYNRGRAIGISAETPTIVAELNTSEMFVGGAGLVVRHLLRLGATVDLLTIVGINDPMENTPLDLIKISSDSFIDKEADRFFDDVVLVDGWKTTSKIRNYVGSYKTLQYDVRNKARLEEVSRAMMIDQFNALFRQVNKVIICDNRHGVLDREFARHIVSSCKENNVPLYVDSQCSQEKSNHEWYIGADVIFLNEHEISEVVKSSWLLDSVENESPIGQAPDVKKYMEAKKLILKRGAFGAFEFGNEVIGVTGETVNAIDTCGAGDAFLAAYVVTDSISKANHWAALSTTYLGTIVPKEKL